VNKSKKEVNPAGLRVTGSEDFHFLVIRLYLNTILVLSPSTGFDTFLWVSYHPTVVSKQIHSLSTKGADMKKSVKIPETVTNLLGKTVNKVKVLKYNEKKSEPGKPVVDCKCLACGKPFSVNAYHVKYETAKSCGCIRVVGKTKKSAKKN
jgi:hypothetical protein